MKPRIRQRCAWQNGYNRGHATNPDSPLRLRGTRLCTNERAERYSITTALSNPGASTVVVEPNFLLPANPGVNDIGRGRGP